MSEEHLYDPWSLDAAVEIAEPKPPRTIIYGNDGVGKTTLAARFPRPFALFTEEGRGAIKIRAFPQRATTWEQVTIAIGRLIGEAQSSERSFDTFVLDSLDWLEPIIWAETCARNEFSSIEAPGYGKGYVEADLVWEEFMQGLDALHSAGVAIVLVAHEEVVRFTPPESDPYDRHDLALHKRARHMLREWADIVAYAHERSALITREEGSGKHKKTITRGGGSLGRYLALERRSTHEAKNRYGLPAEIELRNDSSTADELLAGVGAAFTSMGEQTDG